MCDACGFRWQEYDDETAVNALRLGGACYRGILGGVDLDLANRRPDDATWSSLEYQHFPVYLGAGGDTWCTTPVSLVEVGDWKLMEFLEDGRLELYNLKEDIGESDNLTASMPEKAKELHAKLQSWREAIKAPMTVKNTPLADSANKKKGKGKGKGKGKKAADE